MRQQINLYLPEFRPRRDWLDARRLVQASVGLAGLLVLLGGYDYWRLSSLQGRVPELQQTLATETERAERLEQAVTGEADDALLEEIDEREQRLERSRQLLSFLEQTNLGNTTGFSGYLQDLARATFDGLWLTRIRFSNGGTSIHLQGQAERTAMVPDYVGRLGNGRSALSERRFNRLIGTRVSEDSDGDSAADGTSRSPYYEFELETRQ